MKKLYLLFLVLLATPVYAQLPFNTTNLSNADNIYEFTKEVSTATGDIIGIGILLSVFFITFSVISARYQDAVAGFSAGSFITLLSSVILLPLGLIGFHIFRITLLLAAIAVGGSILVRR